MTAPRPRRDNLTQHEREPAPMSCRCGHMWMSRARDDVTVRCPACKTGNRMHRQHASEPASAQVSAPAQQVHATAAETPPAPPASMPAHAALDDLEDDEDYRPDILPAAVPRAAPAGPSLQDRVFDAIGAAVYGHKVQQLSATRAVVRQAAKMLKVAQRDLEPSIRYRVSELPGGQWALRLWADQADTRLGADVYAPDDPVIVPAIARVVQETLPAIRDAARSLRTGRARPGASARCEWCGAVAGLTTREVVRVTSPALDRPRYLCYLHAQTELTVTGAEAR